MSPEHGRNAVLESLSSLMDGEAEGSAAAEACDLWRERAEARERWHHWHLIGDVLRSDDLASRVVRDHAFLAGLRQQLSDEPVVLAPAAPMPMTERARRRARTGAAAVAAGFIVVAGVVVVMRMSQPSGAAVQFAQQPAVAPVVQPVAVREPAPSPDPQVFIANGRLIRDARLDRYLEAHRQLGGGAAGTIPSNLMLEGALPASTDR